MLTLDSFIMQESNIAKSAWWTMSFFSINMFTLVIFLLSLMTHIQIGQSDTAVRIAVLLPKDPQLPFAMHKVKPAIDLAVHEVQQRRLLVNQQTFEVRYGDTNSSYIVGPLLAIDFYAKNQADVFLGPVDGPGLAAVSR